MLSNSIILRRNVTVEFPKQFATTSDGTEFVRIYAGKSVEIKCPNNFVFDDVLLRCDINSAETHTIDYSEYCGKNFQGVVPNPMKCRTFINCGRGDIAYVQYCPTNQLFSNSSGRCTYPDIANCCEYWEKDSSKIVA